MHNLICFSDKPKKPTLSLDFQTHQILGIKAYALVAMQILPKENSGPGLGPDAIDPEKIKVLRFDPHVHIPLTMQDFIEGRGSGVEWLFLSEAFYLPREWMAMMPQPEKP